MAIPCIFEIKGAHTCQTESMLVSDAITYSLIGMVIRAAVVRALGGKEGMESHCEGCKRHNTCAPQFEQLGDGLADDPDFNDSLLFSTNQINNDP